MIGYVTLGTNKFNEAAKFYDELLAEFGAKRAMDFGTFIAWSASKNQPMLAITLPYNKQEANFGNGTMVGLMAKSKEQVDAIHKKALELGGTDEGAPGPRSGNFYAGYFRDLDGNKLNAFFME